jgi:hypothetical protein
MRTSGNERDNFCRSIQIGSLLLKGKKAEVAVGFLESLDEKIEHYRLERWDPGLCVEVWSTLYQAYGVSRANKAQPVQQALSEKQGLVLTKLSRINPRSACKLHS